MKNNIIYLVLFISAMAFSSCEKFLDEEPISQIGANGFYSNLEEVNTGIISVYATLNNLPNIEYALTEMRSDNAGTRTGEGDWGQFQYMNVDPTNVSVGTYWTTSYNAIYQVNNMLQYIDNVSDETLKNQYAGELYFLRALTYFNMVRLYGDIPLIENVVAPEEAESYSVRANTSTIYQFIQTDLNNAVSMLMSRGSVAEGRATKGAAQTLLAKLQLKLGNYAEARTLCESVIASGSYSLASTYDEVFAINAPSGTDEIIFAYQYISGDAANSQNFSYEFSPKGVASGINWPTDDLINNVDTSLADGDGDLRTPTLFYWNDAAGNSGDWACGKFLEPDNNQIAGQLWIVFRLADVYLMYCEAVLGNATSTTDATALGYINAIRSRASLTPLASITPDNLLLERRVELAFENHRLFDLIRFGKADEILGAFATGEGGFAYDTRDLLLPIPQSELAIYDMGQNPGY